MAWSNLRRDYRRLADYRGRASLRFWLETVLFDNGFQAVIAYRLSNWAKRQRIPLLGPLVWRCAIACTGADVNPNARIGPGLVISHGVGLVIGGAARLGAEALVHHGVTIGAATASRIGEMPTLGDRVVVGAGASVIGAVTVGDDCFLGAHVLVTEDVAAGSKIVQAASR